MTGRGPTILHADLDAFYASVEQLLDPSLRGHPVAVGGGVVLAASYEAKRYGVTAGMPGWKARQLCPELRFASGHFREYQRLGDAVVDVLRDFTPLVERISIDEAFLDVAGSIHLLGPARAIAEQIRARVRGELGLPISVGVATTKHLAKVASQVAKPDGLVVVEAGEERAFLDPLPVELLWGVGPATRKRLSDWGVHTIGDLARTAPQLLQRLLGHVVGSTLLARSLNDDARGVETTHRARSVGAQTALGRRPAEPTVVRTALGHVADRVASRLRAAGLAGRTVTVRVRFRDLRAVTRAVTLGAPIASTLTLTDIGVELAMGVLADHPAEREITLLGIAVTNLVEQPTLQLELDLGVPDQRLRPGTPAGLARWNVDRAMDRVRNRFGRAAVGYAAVCLSDLRGAPDEFRELAEAEVRARGAARPPPSSVERTFRG